MKFTMNYWIDDGWYIGKIKEVPGIFSQGTTLEELIKNIQDAYKLIMEENSVLFNRFLNNQKFFEQKFQNR